jgi:hypothetical protein
VLCDLGLSVWEWELVEERCTQYGKLASRSESDVLEKIRTAKHFWVTGYCKVCQDI